MANIQRLWHAEEDCDQNDAVEDGCQFENPPPAQVLTDEAADNRCEVITIDHGHGVDTHGSTSLVEEEKVGDGDCA